MKENVSIQLHVADIQASGTIDDVMKLSRDSEYTFFVLFCFFVVVFLSSWFHVALEMVPNVD